MRKIIAVYLSTIKDFNKNQSSVISSLPFGDKEKSRLDAIKNSKAKVQSLTALSSLKSLADIFISSDKDLEILRTDNNKPYFSKNDFHFSLSHSNNIACAVLSDLPIGIDVEFIEKERDFNKLSQKFFTLDEQKSIQNSDKSALSFYSLWTKKEAFSKISGDGLLAICRRDRIDKIFCKQYLIFLNTDHYIISVCAESTFGEIKLYNSTKELSIYEL